MRKILVAAVAFGAAFSVPAYADHDGDPHWIQSFDTNCWIYNASPQENETVAWNGRACGIMQDEADGEGTVTWFTNGVWTIAERGVMRGGKMQGFWTRNFANSGRTETSYWEDGVRKKAPNVAVADGGPSGQSSQPSDKGMGATLQDTWDKNQRENCLRAQQGQNVAC